MQYYIAVIGHGYENRGRCMSIQYGCKRRVVSLWTAFLWLLVPFCLAARADAEEEHPQRLRVATFNVQDVRSAEFCRVRMPVYRRRR